MVLAEIALPLLRVKAKRSYSGAELRELCAAPASRPASTPRCIVVRLFILVRLDVDAIAVFAPDEGAALMRSVVHGFGWGIGHEIAHSVFGHGRSRKSRRLTRRTQRRVEYARPRERNPPELARAYAGYSGCGTPTNVLVAVYRRHD